MYFVGQNADLYTISAIAMMYFISCHIGLHYSGTRLYIHGLVQNSNALAMELLPSFTKPFRVNYND